MQNTPNSYQVPQKQSAAQFYYSYNKQIRTSDAICVALTQMVASGFLSLSVNGFQYTFIRTPLPAMTMQEKEYARIFGTAPLTINGAFNPLLCEFNKTLQHTAQNAKSVFEPSTPKSSTTKFKKGLQIISLILAGTCGLTLKLKLSSIHPSHLVQMMMQKEILILTGIAIVCGLYFLFSFIKESSSLRKRVTDMTTLFKQELGGVAYLKDILQTNPTTTLSHIPAKQLFPYVMAISKDWNELAKQAQHQPALQPLMDLCTPDFKQTVETTINQNR